jgi:hypothetical protein
MVKSEKGKEYDRHRGERKKDAEKKGKGRPFRLPALAHDFFMQFSGAFHHIDAIHGDSDRLISHGTDEPLFLEIRHDFYGFFLGKTEIGAKLEHVHRQQLIPFRDFI